MHLGEFTKTLRHVALTLKLVVRVWFIENLGIIIESVHRWIGLGSSECRNQRGGGRGVKESIIKTCVVCKYIVDFSHVL